MLKILDNSLVEHYGIVTETRAYCLPVVIRDGTKLVGLDPHVRTALEGVYNLYPHSWPMGRAGHLEYAPYARFDNWNVYHVWYKVSAVQNWIDNVTGLQWGTCNLIQTALIDELNSIAI